MDMVTILRSVFVLTVAIACYFNDKGHACRQVALHQDSQLG